MSARPTQVQLLVLSITSMIALCGFASARHQALRFCSADMPAFARQIEGAKQSLGPWINAKTDEEGASRSPASVAEPGLSEQDRRSWKKWAEQKLIEAQGLEDVAESQPQWGAAKTAFAQAANLLVEFHGYVTLGQVIRMESTLARIEKLTNEASKSSCQ